MRVLILGEDAPGGLMASYARGFAELGAGVTTFCLARAYEAVVPARRWRVVRRVAERLGERIALGAFNGRVRKALGGAAADLVLVLKGHRLEPETVHRLRLTTGAPVVNFYPDDPFSSDRSNHLVHGPGVLAAYDACFTFARHLIPRYAAAGVRAVSHLPFARDPALHAPVPPARAEFDVVFVGNLDAERVRWMEALAGVRLAIFGERTTAAVRRRSPLRRATFGPAAYGPRLARTLARGAISLNVMRAQNARSHNMRSFESPACGAFTLSQRTPELQELFEEGKEIACFDSPAELRDAALRWLADEAGRRRIAAAGLERVREETYARRAATILEQAGVMAGALP